MGVCIYAFFILGGLPKIASRKLNWRLKNAGQIIINNNNDKNNIIYIVLYAKVLKRFTMEEGNR